MTECKWDSKKGNSYTYYVYKLPHSFQDEDGNYIFAKLEGNTWWPVYIGQGNLKNRANLNNRTDNVACIRQNGATHVHAHSQSNKEKRLEEETDLINSYDTPCND